MARSLSQPQTTKSPTRVAIGGISLLMVVAFAVQASAGVQSAALQARQHSGVPTIRLIAEAVTRRVERQTRRHEERPAVCRVTFAATARVVSGEPVESLAPVAQPRRLSVLLTNLPPPGDPRV